MGRQNVALYALNGGAVSPRALVRADLSKLTICSEVDVNWSISTLGSRRIRPGTIDQGQTHGNNATRLMKFVGTASTCSLIELTPGQIRIRNDGEILERVSVDTVIENGDFSLGGDHLDGWTIDLASGGAVTADTGSATLLGTGVERTSITRKIDVALADRGKEHGFNITVPRGPVDIAFGTAAYLDDVVLRFALGTGRHSLAVTPTADVWITLSSNKKVDRIVGPLSIEAAGPLSLPTPWGEDDIPFVRYAQQGDVIFVACRERPQKRIESRSRRSWAVVDYVFEKGPYRARDETSVSLNPLGRKGVIQLDASDPIFSPDHVGALFEMTQTGQQTSVNATGGDQFTDYIRVNGVHEDRIFTATVAGTFTGKATLQRAFGAPEIWTDYRTYTAPAVYFDEDGLENALVYYRLGVKAGDYTSGTFELSIKYDGGTTATPVRIVSYVNPKRVFVEVSDELSNPDGTTNWREGEWSAFRGFPRDVGFQDGRLWWLGKDLVWASVSDDYAIFDDATEGDSAPIIRSVATGPADGNVWLSMLYRMFIASATQVNQVRASSLDEPVTAKLFGVRLVDDIGAADIAPIAIGSRGVFVGRSSVDLYEIGFTGAVGDFGISLLSRLNPDILQAGVVKLEPQRRPEPRLWCVLGDGTVAVLTYNRDEEVIAWTTFETDGFVEDVCVMPNVLEDDVYLVVNRLMNGGFTRRIERCAYEIDSNGDDTNQIGDCGVTLTSDTPQTVWTGLGFYNGREVVAWADGEGYENLTVSGGQVELPVASREVWIALPYKATWRSAKLAYAATGGTALGQKKRVDHLAILARDTARIGLRFGSGPNHLNDMPTVLRGKEVDPTRVERDIDDVATAFNGTWDTDSRIYAEVRAPWPATLTAAVISLTTHDAR